MMAEVVLSVLVCVTIPYVFFRVVRSDRGLDRLQKLPTNLLEVMRAADRRLIYSAGNVSIRELILALRNFRMLAHEGDRIRLADPVNRDEFDSLHATLALNGREMTRRLVCAFVEKAFNCIVGNGVQLYAYAALESYRLEVELLVNILELGGDCRSATLEAHLP
jgi:hypothetical protein